MPYQQVMHKFKHGLLHSGSKSGPKVKDRKQAIAIMLSEKKKGEVDTSPSDKVKKKFGRKSKFVDDEA
jgi:hypothetical protein